MGKQGLDLGKAINTHPAVLNSDDTRALKIWLTPADTAVVISPSSIFFDAKCAVTIEDEHAVSRERDGPRRANINESRPAATDKTLPARI